MKQFTLTIKMENAAFTDNSEELVKLVHRVADKLSRGQEDGLVIDSNGNRVGEFAVEA